MFEWPPTTIAKFLILFFKVKEVGRIYDLGCIQRYGIIPYKLFMFLIVVIQVMHCQLLKTKIVLPTFNVGLTLTVWYSFLFDCVLLININKKLAVVFQCFIIPAKSQPIDLAWTVSIKVIASLCRSANQNNFFINSSGVKELFRNISIFIQMLKIFQGAVILIFTANTCWEECTNMGAIKKTLSLLGSRILLDWFRRSW